MHQTRNGWWHKRPWGAWSLISLYLSILSGIIVGLQYDYATAFYSVTAIDLLAPYGRFWRSLHFYSSQGCFLFAVIHLGFCCQKAEKLIFAEWTKLFIGLMALLLLLFTGYVLRGDNTGSSAGLIAENLIRSIPVLGNLLNDILFSISTSGLRKVYVHHIIGLDALLLLLLWDHLRTYRVKIGLHFPLLILTVVFSIFIAAPLEPEQIGRQYISGPWFFLGLQELLRYLPPLLAGIIFPSLLGLLLLATYPRPRNQAWRKPLWTAIFLWLAAYTVLTVFASIR